MFVVPTSYEISASKQCRSIVYTMILYALMLTTHLV